MDEMDIEKYKIIINDKIKNLYHNTVDTSVDEDGDEIDLAQSSFLADMAYAQRDRNNQNIALLSEALEKIKSKSYGYCEECEEEIGRKRLDIFPEARHCIQCAEIMEKNRKAFR